MHSLYLGRFWNLEKQDISSPLCPNIYQLIYSKDTSLTSFRGSMVSLSVSHLNYLVGAYSFTCITRSLKWTIYKFLVREEKSNIFPNKVLDPVRYYSTEKVKLTRCYSFIFTKKSESPSKNVYSILQVCSATHYVYFGKSQLHHSTSTRTSMMYWIATGATPTLISMCMLPQSILNCYTNHNHTNNISTLKFCYMCYSCIPE